MPGFGSGPFGTGGFGEWPWSLITIVEGVPNIYREQDDLSGQGTLQALLEGLAPSLDQLRRKVRDYDELRDPLVAPIEQSFLVGETILKTEDLGDGTSRVFMSEGADGDKFEGVRPGMTLIDFRGIRFVVCKVLKSSLASEFTDPPTDPATGLPTGKHIIVANVGQVSTELIPFVSGTQVTRENPAVDAATGSIVAVDQANIIDGETFTLDDGVNPPLIFEFDTVPDGVAGTNIQVDISLAVLDVQVADAMVDAINAATPLNLVADNGSGTLGTVTITNPATGEEGNVTWTKTVADAGFIVNSPTGGGAGAYIVDGTGTLVDDGVRTGPYVFSLDGSITNGSDIALNRVTLEWTEGGERKEGFFTNEGKPGGDLADTSTIEYSADSVNAGQLRIFTDSGIAIDANSILVTYTEEISPPPEDAEIRAQNILAFLANDVGIRLDRNDPEFLQRSYVNSAYKIWDIKGTDLGYDVLGQYAGYFVAARPLYAIIESIALGLPPDTVFEFPAGTAARGTITCIAASNFIDGETFTLDDGVNTPVTFEFDTVPDGVTGGNVVVNISSAVTAIDVADAVTAAINGAGALDLNADNVAGTSNVVTVTNATTGEVGNVTTWSETVLNGGFIVGQPTGGTNGQYYTTIDPGRPQFDEVILDAIPLDQLCTDAAFPTTTQSVVATSVTQTGSEGSNKRTEVIVTAADMEESFGTEGVFTDFSGTDFVMENFERIDETGYRFETSSFVIPVVGAGTVDWKAFKFEVPNAVSIDLVSATGSILADTPASYTDGQTFHLIGSDGRSATFEFDVLGDGVSGGNIAVNISAATTADDVKIAIISAVNGTDSVDITADNGGLALANLTQDLGGVEGNTNINTVGFPPGVFTDFSGGSGNVTDLGRQFVGYEGRRYRIRESFTDPPLADVGNWAFIDNDGVVSYIESFAEVGDGTGDYEFDIISGSRPATGAANVFLKCEVVTDCDFCRASSILVRISPTTILDYPEALEGDALSRLIIRLEQMIPGHVRIAAFIFDPGPAVAEWGFIAATSTSSESAEDDALYSSFYDEDEFPADEIPADSAPIVATSTVETAAVQAEGSLTFGNTNILDGEVFSLDDGVNATVTFEFDDNASVVESAVLRRVDISAATTVDDFKNATITAISGAPSLDITASDGGTGVVDLINDTAGSQGVQPINEAVTDPGFVVVGMAGPLWGEWFNQNVLEEFIEASDPITDGTWTATGLWSVTEYRSSTQYRSFNYGQNDAGRLGEVGAVAPDYDTGAINTGTLTSPTVNIPSASTVTLRIWHYGDARGGGGDDDMRIDIIDEGVGVVATITKTDLGLSTGTNGGFTMQEFIITGDIVGIGDAHLEFVFDTITDPSGVVLGEEGWYIDGVEIQVTP